MSGAAGAANGERPSRDRARSGHDARRRWRIIGATALVVGLVAAGLVVVLSQFIRPDCFDRAAFEKVVTQLPPPPTEPDAYDPVDTPDKIGSCRVLALYGVHGGYIFYDRDSRGFDDSGWGYFPNGPSADLGNGSWEGPQFEQIEGSWYTWTASW